MTKTKTVIKTEKVECVDCSSCGQEIEKNDAYDFMISNSEDIQREGKVCEHCVENIVSFPVIYQTLGENTNWGDVALAIASLAFAVMFILKSIQMLLPLIM